MSLVNDMLRDLDRRRRQPSDSSVSFYRNDEEGDQVARKGLGAILLPVAGIAIGIVAGYVYFSQPEQPSASVAVQSASPEAVNAVAGNGVAEPAAGLQAGAKANGISIASVSDTAGGFSVSISSPADFTFDIVSQNSYGLNLLLHDVTSIASNSAVMPGLSVMKTAGGYNLILELNRTVDFRVFKESANSARPGMTLYVEAVYRTENADVSSTVVNPDAGVNAGNNTTGRSNGGSVEPAVTAPAAVAASGNGTAQRQNAGTTNSAATTPASENTTVRTTRELTFEQRDTQISQNASQLIQRGQMMTAYQELLAFIGEYPEAHRSRSTLATLLLAQQEYEQAGIIVDQGLGIAPNYGPYKKVKARLFMMNSQTAEAAQLLKTLPPALSSDPEYFELLASSYQQNGDFLSAINIYQELLRYDNQQGRWWAGLGIAHESLGDVEDAIASFQAAVQRAGLEPALRQYSENRMRYLKQ